MQRKVAAYSREFWQRFAHVASPSYLGKILPPSSGGLSQAGWQHAIRRCRSEYDDLTWYQGKRGVWFVEPDVVPEPVYVDEVACPEPTKAIPGQAASPDSYRETTEIRKDGSCVSDKLVEMSEEQSKDPAFMLTAHGFDTEKWELVTARNSMWQVITKSDDCERESHTLYASKITARPLVKTIDVAAIAEALDGTKPVKVTRPRRGSGMLELGLCDMHLGNSDFDHYRDTLSRLVALIESREWDTIVIPIGSDMFHCDNFKNTTSNGTPQSSVDWTQAWEDATAFFATVIEAALGHSKNVSAYYIIGNHDESMAWAFCRGLTWKYPQLDLDTSIAERKVHVWHDVAVGLTHGDSRNRKDIDRVFYSEFPAFASARIREVHAAHYHHEVSVDQFGVVTRSLSTAARTDKWHREEGYVGAMKRFMCFEYEPSDLAGIHFV